MNNKFFSYFHTIEAFVWSTGLKHALPTLVDSKGLTLPDANPIFPLTGTRRLRVMTPIYPLGNLHMVLN